MILRLDVIDGVIDQSQRYIGVQLYSQEGRIEEGRTDVESFCEYRK